MIINRANQTWLSDVTQDLSGGKPCQGGCGRYRSVLCSNSPTDWLCYDCRVSTEPLDEFERRQRGGASTLAALAVVTLFIIFAVAAMPLINSLGGK